MSDLEALEQWAAPLVAALSPAARRGLLRALALDLRRSQQQRIARQQNPDGSAYTPRRRLHDERGGRIRRRAMFQRIRQARHLKATVEGGGVRVGYTGRVARIARVHQDGGIDAVRPGGALARYARRQLLGFSPADRDRLRERLVAHLAGCTDAI
ncbi:phage virion morphogenesis protein [Lysobacter firmicutimachus]|uniref:Phage virion morphogenesis protein n=1 Tax=Lysobacter firmicutimachus TaxID=1792846 RepID=A0ABU8D0Q2_9GAMM